MHGVRQDLRYALRMLSKSPGFAIVTVLTLALGIGANTVMFGIVNTVLLSPLPYERPESLVSVWDIQPRLDHAPASFPSYLAWRAQETVFQDLGAYFGAPCAMTGHGEPENVNGIRMSASLLPMLGMKPERGRGFLPEEEPPGAQRVAMISPGIWQRRFGGRADVIGGTITLDDQAYTVIGVLPSGFRLGDDPDVALPLGLDTSNAKPGMHFLDVLGRLRPGVSVPQARAGLASLPHRLREEGIDDHEIGLQGLQAQVVETTGPSLLLFLGAVGCVLLIACGNVANLLLARAASRGKEIAVRMALGAGRARLVRQFLTESMLLALGGGAFGLLLAWWCVDLLAAVPGTGIPRLSEVRLDGTVFLFTAALSAVTGLLFGLAPSLHATSGDLQETLKEAGRGTSGGGTRSRLRASLVVTEVALSLVLLVGAGLLIRSFASLMSVPKGFESGDVVAAGVALRQTRYPGQAQQAEFLRQVLDRLAGLPGVSAAAVANFVPLGGHDPSGEFGIEGRTFPVNEAPLAAWHFVSADYFRVMRIPVVKGRTFGSQEVENGLKAVIVSESFARQFFPGEDPIGKRLDHLWGADGWHTIVGVVGDVRHGSLERASLPDIYLHYLQRTEARMIFVLKTTSTPTSMGAALRAQVAAVDKDQPVAWVRSMDDVVASSVEGRRLSMWILGAFAGTALFLAAVGIYGVLSYSVAQRHHEIGIRMALGAGRREVLRMVIGHGMALAGAGVAIGLALAAGATRLMTGLLFGVGSTDPATFGGIPLLLAVVALAASWVPARRATKVDPMVALRNE